MMYVPAWDPYLFFAANPGPGNLRRNFVPLNDLFQPLLPVEFVQVLDDERLNAFFNLFTLFSYSCKY